MKKILFKSALLALAAPLFLASCSSDSNDEPNIEPAEVSEGIMLSIPNVQTRALTDDEVKVNSLKVIIYKSDNLNTPHYVKNLSGADVSGITTTPTYTTIPIALKAGDYKMYIVANIGSYTVKDKNNTELKETTWESVSEENLEAAKITSGVTAIRATTMSGNGRAYLPMGCSNYDMKKKGSGDSDYSQVGNGTITVSSGSLTSVQAELTICVAKVNVTVINQSLPSVTLTSLQLNPYSTASGLVADDNNLSKGTDAVTLSGNYYLYDASGNVGTTASDATAAAANTKGWQWTTTYYVAENLYQNRDDADKTKLNFAFSNSTYDKTGNNARVLDDKTQDAVKGVKRGFQYNVIGTIKGKTLDIDVLVNEWQYHKSVQDLME